MVHTWLLNGNLVLPGVTGHLSLVLLQYKLIYSNYTVGKVPQNTSRTVQRKANLSSKRGLATEGQY